MGVLLEFPRRVDPRRLSAAIEKAQREIETPLSRDADLATGLAGLAHKIVLTAATLGIAAPSGDKGDGPESAAESALRALYADAEALMFKSLDYDLNRRRVAARKAVATRKERRAALAASNPSTLGQRKRSARPKPEGPQREFSF